MIHPQTELRYVNSTIGFGVYATVPLPRGTILYVQDPLDIVLQGDDPKLQISPYKEMFAKYSTVEPDGSRMLSWDNARFVNHACQSNCLSTGYGFEIAVRDIAAGEAITDDYGQFNLPYEMVCSCGSAACREVVRPTDFWTLVPQWDALITEAFPFLVELEQPLWPFLDEDTQTAVLLDIARQHPRSVGTLHHTSIGR